MACSDSKPDSHGEEELSTDWRNQGGLWGRGVECRAGGPEDGFGGPRGIAEGKREKV